MTRSVRKTLARLAVVCVLVSASMATTGCGTAGHYIGGVVAHHIANHFAKTPAARRRVSKAYCVYSVYRAFHDLTHHHLIFGALNVHQALKNCEAGFGKNHH
jgi:ribosomal protein L34E